MWLAKIATSRLPFLERFENALVTAQVAQAPDKITRERDSIERYNGLNL